MIQLYNDTLIDQSYIECWALLETYKVQPKAQHFLSKYRVFIAKP
jgi:hypothetical protein